jgi:hypothetical protein
MSAPFSVRITQVRNISTEKVGFGKGLLVYSVTAVTSQAIYSTYCVGASPESGKSYSALDAYVDDSLSVLRLWPVAKANLNLPPSQSTKGRAYRVMIFKDVRNDPRMPPDLSCDIKTETAILP